MDSNQEQADLEQTYLDQINMLVRTMPSAISERMDRKTRNELAHALTDGTVFEIVRGLKDIQDMTEKDLFQERARLVQEQRGQRERIRARHEKELMAVPPRASHQAMGAVQDAHEKELSEFDSKSSEAMRQTDLKYLEEFDGLVVQQQQTMVKASIPGFSSNSEDAELHMYMLRMMLQLADVYR